MTTPPNRPDHDAGPSRPVGSRQGWRLVAVLLLGAGISLAACSSGSTSSPSTTAAGSTATSGGSGSDAIAIQNFAFAPDSLTVAPGATVTVTNHDQVAHTVTAVKGAFNTGNILPSQSKTFTAPNTPGTYAYICSIHQYMTGTLVVSG